MFGFEGEGGISRMAIDQFSLFTGKFDDGDFEPLFLTLIKATHISKTQGVVALSELKISSDNA